MCYTINAPAKINIGLDVIRKRSDGYHDLKMIMQTINLSDTLEFTVTDENTDILTCSNKKLPVDDNNLVIKAVKLMKETYGINASFHINLIKNIPVAAGMAGGSTDAAACFTALNDMFKLGISKEELMKLSVKLGADIPYCIMQGTALSEGIGDILTPLPPFDDVFFLIAKPDIDVSTGFVYKNLKLTNDTCHPDIDGIIRAMHTHNYSEMSALMGNILETVTIPCYPVIGTLKKLLKDEGAFASLMSGSGPTVFGLFDDINMANAAKDACSRICNGIFTAVTTPYNP